MKKIISFLTVIIILSLCSFSAFASTNEETSIFYFEDGSYIETTINIYGEKISTYATKTIVGDKRITFKNSDGDTEWDATVKGTFTYTGSSATCTNATISYNIYDSKWKMKEATASKSGNKAIGDVTAKRYALGIPVQTVEQTFYLTCSATGTLS